MQLQENVFILVLQSAMKFYSKLEALTESVNCGAFTQLTQRKMILRCKIETTFLN